MRCVPIPVATSPGSIRSINSTVCIAWTASMNVYQTSKIQTQMAGNLANYRLAREILVVKEIQADVRHNNVCSPNQSLTDVQPNGFDHITSSAVPIQYRLN